MTTTILFIFQMHLWVIFPTSACLITTQFRTLRISKYTTSSKQEARALAVFFMADSSKNLEQMKVIWKKGTDPLLLACKSCIISDIWSYSYGCGNWPSTFQAKLAQRGATKDYKEVVKFNSKSPKISAYRQMFIF